MLLALFRHSNGRLHRAQQLVRISLSWELHSAKNLRLGEPFEEAVRTRLKLLFARIAQHRRLEACRGDDHAKKHPFIHLVVAGREHAHAERKVDEPGAGGVRMLLKVE
ncbi:hypothetical protein D9M68_900610 [compost metagenome]